MCGGGEARKGGISESQRLQVPHTEAWALSGQARALGKSCLLLKGSESKEGACDARRGPSPLVLQTPKCLGSSCSGWSVEP